VSFSSLEAGHASSAGAALYPLRTLERDLLEREIRRELDAWHDRAQGEPAERIEDDMEGWLLSDDSPLLLLNVPEFVVDPEAHLRALAEQVEGAGRTSPQFTGAELVSSGRGDAPLNSSRNRAEELRARLRTFAEADAERILATPRRRGTPKGETRTHLIWLNSPDRDISNRQLKLIMLEIICRRWPGGAKAVGYFHRDTDNTHLHIWLSAELLSGKKISVTRATPSGDPILDKYPDLDEEVALAISRHFNDPSIYSEHMAKKLEWVYWRERFEESLRRGERPPIMPYRARHDYDWVGERRAISNREREEKPPRSDKKEKAAPVPRVKSLMGALELYGKTVYFEAKVKYRRALLESLEIWRSKIDYPITGVKQYFERELEKSEREHERYKNAFERTLENRARKEYPELKYALHNSKQIAEMTQIAHLTRDAQLLRHVRSYTRLDRSTDSEEQVRDLGSKWRDHVEARLEVLERADRLVQVTGQRDMPQALDGVAPTTDPVRPIFNQNSEIVRGWLEGNWTHEQMLASMPCFETESARLHAARYLKAREFFVATGEVLAEERGAAGATFAAWPALEERDLTRITHLVGSEVSNIPERECALLRDLAAVSRSKDESSRREITRLLELDLKTDAGRSGEIDLTKGARGHQEIFRPHDDVWAGRLARTMTINQTEALALSMNGSSREKLNALREEISAHHQILALTRAIRASFEMPPDAPVIAAGVIAERDFGRHSRIIAAGLRSHGEKWDAWQIAGVEEFKAILPPHDQEKAVLIIEEAKMRRHEERRTQALERLEPHLESAAETYVYAAYEAEGLRGLSQPEQFDEHIQILAERFAQVTRDAGYVPERLGLTGPELETRAESVLSDAVGRFTREEPIARELGRLEAQMILACAERDAATTRRLRFDDHYPIHNWTYQTLEEKGSTSLCELRFAPYEITDRAERLVAESARNEIERSIDEVRAHYTGKEAPLIEAAATATQSYEARVRISEQREHSFRFIVNTYFAPS
jgi:hypothetical protein